MNLLIALLLLVPQDGAASESALKEEAARIAAVREAIPKTALIVIKAKDKDTPVGSGGVVSADGYVVTCAHVVEAAPQLGLSLKDDIFEVVLSDGKTRKAKLVARNSANDIALLKIEGDKLPHFEVAADRRPSRGDTVLGLGFPLGNLGLAATWTEKRPPHPSVALGRVVDPNLKFPVHTQGQEPKYYPDCIESDVPLFFGNSGGPLIDAKGSLLGLNGAISGAGSSYTLSVASIARCLDDLKAGRDVQGEKQKSGLKDYGRALWDSLNAKEEEVARREYLLENFVAMAKSHRNGVVALYRGQDQIGYATVMDDEGRLVASLRALDRKSFWSRIGREIEDSLDPEWKKIWKRTQELFGGKEPPLEVRLPSGARVQAIWEKNSERLGLALLRIDPGNEKLQSIKTARASKMEPGAWVAVLGDSAPLAVGLLSNPSHTVSAGRVPMSGQEWLDAWSNRELEQHEFKETILIDATLAARQLGTPLCDSRGRMIGITVFHPSRGTSYAVPIAEVKKEFGLGRY